MDETYVKHGQNADLDGWLPGNLVENLIYHEFAERRGRDVVLTDKGRQRLNGRPMTQMPDPGQGDYQTPKKRGRGREPDD